MADRRTPTKGKWGRMEVKQNSPVANGRRFVRGAEKMATVRIGKRPNRRRLVFYQYRKGSLACWYAHEPAKNLVQSVVILDARKNRWKIISSSSSREGVLGLLLRVGQKRVKRLRIRGEQRGKKNN